MAEQQNKLLSERVQKALVRSISDRHVIMDPADWSVPWKETILALNGVKEEAWDELLINASWWTYYGMRGGEGVDDQGNPLPVPK